MVDVETLSNPDHTNTSAIIAIGAVQFNPLTGEIGKEFMCKVDLQSSIDLGLEISADTLRWWIQPERIEVFRELLSKGIHINHAFTLLTQFLAEVAGYKSGLSKETLEEAIHTLHLWGRSPRFDLTILQQAQSLAQIKVMWDPKKELDVRTIEWLNPAIKKGHDVQAQGNGTYYTHDPLLDAKHQIKYVSAIYQSVKPN